MRELFLIDETRCVTRYTDISVDQLQDTLEKNDGLFWLDIEPMTDEDAEWLKTFKEFRFHARSLEECRVTAGRPKLNEFPNHLFLVMYIPDGQGTPEPAGMTKFCIFLTPDYLVTAHTETLPFLRHVKDHLEQDYRLMQSPGFCLSMILEAMMDHLDPAIAHLDGEVSAMHNLIPGTASPENLQDIGRLKRYILALHQTFRPQAEMLHELVTQTYPQMQPETIIQIRTTYHRFMRILELLEQYRESLVDLRDGYLAYTATQIQGTARRLTTIAAVFLPLTCLAALFGMNEQVIPGLTPPYGYLIAAALLAVVAVVIAMATKRE